MRTCHLELLDVLRAEIADLYRPRREDDARLRRLEWLTKRSLRDGHDPFDPPPADHEPTETR